MNEKIHHGRNIKRFREMMGIKQEALAHELGEDWSQKKISLLVAKGRSGGGALASSRRDLESSGGGD